MKKKPLKEQSHDVSTRTRDEELKNQDKLTKNLYFEYERLMKRLDKISDPSYPIKLRRRNQEIEAMIKTLTKE